jgi:hypothetical protein
MVLNPAQALEPPAKPCLALLPSPAYHYTVGKVLNTTLKNVEINLAGTIQYVCRSKYPVVTRSRPDGCLLTWVRPFLPSDS